LAAVASRKIETAKEFAAKKRIGLVQEEELALLLMR
jgi:hypothetical protein